MSRSVFIPARRHLDNPCVVQIGEHRNVVLPAPEALLIDANPLGCFEFAALNAPLYRPSMTRFGEYRNLD